MEKYALFFNYKCYSSSNFKSLCLFHLFYCSQYVRWQFFSYLQKLARRFAVVCPTRRAFSRLEGCITPPYPPPPGSFGPDHVHACSLRYKKGTYFIDNGLTIYHGFSPGLLNLVTLLLYFEHILNTATNYKAK